VLFTCAGHLGWPAGLVEPAGPRSDSLASSCGAPRWSVGGG